jgi:hypothetical protein
LAHYFFDTSGLVKYYHVEVGTLVVSKIFAERERRIRISSLGVLETQSAFAMKVRSGTLAREGAGLQRARLMLDISAGEIEVFSVSEDHFVAAERLVGRHGFARRLRALDALQLAVALDLHNQGLVDSFVAADQSLCEVAVLEGLNVINPAAV